MDIVLRWWLAFLVMGLAGWPVTLAIFKKWDSRGYIFAKVIGMGLVFYVAWVIGTFKILPFNQLTIVLISGLVFITGLVMLGKKQGTQIRPDQIRLILFEEVLFLVLLGFWTWVRGHNPDIRDLEKFMDFGFAQSIWRGEFFPPNDMWFAGGKINYYYFGHLIMAGLAKLSALPVSEAFNLMLASLFSFCFTGGFAIARRLLSGLTPIKIFLGGLFTAYLLTMGGNLHTVYTLTKGYKFDENNPAPFWEILINPFDKQARLSGWQTYWYPNATRFIPYTIHEFPSYSFVVSDVHGHVLDIPFALLAVALLITIMLDKPEKRKWLLIGYGVLCGWMFTTSALDGPIYLGILAILLIAQNFQLQVQGVKKVISDLVLVTIVFGLTTLPFTHHFDSFVSGVGVNCPPVALAAKRVGAEEVSRKIGPLIFETAEKCQKSPPWMLFTLWGFFVFGGIAILKLSQGEERKMFAALGIACTGLILFAEFFYFKDIYPQHFRSNTMFKLGYQVFMIMSIVAGVAIVRALNKWRKNLIILAVAVPLVYLVAIYPLLSVRAYFGELTGENFKSVDGLTWLQTQMPDDWEAITWLNTHEPIQQQPVILEAPGDSYTEYDRISTFTGLPTVAGWAVHEWLWRGDYGPIGSRSTEVASVYEAATTEQAQVVIDKYKVKYIVVGDLERKKYLNIREDIIASLGQKVFESQNGATKIYRVN